LANELTINWSLAFAKVGVTTPTGSDVSAPVGLNFPQAQFTVTGTTGIENFLSVAITETLIPLGGLTSPHWAYFWNLDDTNYVQLRPNTGLAAFARLYPGVGFLIPLDQSMVPYAIANTAPVVLRYAIWPR
jgi:hypothetical protein